MEILVAMLVPLVAGYLSVKPFLLELNEPHDPGCLAA